MRTGQHEHSLSANWLKRRGVAGAGVEAPAQAERRSRGAPQRKSYHKDGFNLCPIQFGCPAAIVAALIRAEIAWFGSPRSLGGICSKPEPPSAAGRAVIDLM